MYFCFLNVVLLDNAQREQWVQMLLQVRRALHSGAETPVRNLSKRSSVIAGTVSAVNG